LSDIGGALIKLTSRLSFHQVWDFGMIEEFTRSTLGRSQTGEDLVNFLFARDFQKMHVVDIDLS
jgi:hypothetical protein